MVFHTLQIPAQNHQRFHLFPAKAGLDLLVGPAVQGDGVREVAVPASFRSELAILEVFTGIFIKK